MKKYIISLALVFSSAFVLSQGTFTTGGSGGNWNNSGTWSLVAGSDGDGIPDSDDDVFILNDGVTVNVNVSVANLRIENSSGIVAKGGFDSPRTITISGNLRGDDGTGSPLTPTVNVFSDTNVTLIFTGSGTIISNWSTTSPFENLTISGSGSATIGSDFAIGGGSLSISGSTQINFNGDITNDGTFSVSIPAVFNGGAGQIVDGTSAVSFTGTVTFNNSMNFDVGATFGSTITAGSNALSFETDFTNNGTFNSTGTVTFDGNSTQSIAGSASTSFENLTISNTTATVTIGGGGSSVEGVLSVSSGGTLATGGLLTLVSDATGTARVADLTGATVSGNVDYERYFDGSGDVWRNFGIAVSAGLVTDITTGGFTVNGNDLAYYNEATDAWVDQDAFGASLSNTRGYSLYTRAEDGTNTISFTGSLNTGVQNMTVTNSGSGGDAGWNLVNNPYASTIDFDLLTRGNLDNNVAVWNTASDGYDYWNGSTGNLTNGLISSGQAFWVHSSSGTPSLTINETDKSSSSSSFLKTESEPLTNHLVVTLTQDEKKDKTFIHFRGEASNDFDIEFDALKLSNGIYNISSKAATGENLAINSMSSLISCNTLVLINIDNISAGLYELSFDDVTSFNGASITLNDIYLGSSSELTEGEIYNFEVTADVASWGDGRFELIFSTSPILDETINDSHSYDCITSTINITLENTVVGQSYTLLKGIEELVTLIGNGETLNFEMETSIFSSDAIDLFDIKVNNECNESLISDAISIDYPTLVATAEAIDTAITGTTELNCGDELTSINLSNTSSNYSYDLQYDGISLETKTGVSGDLVFEVNTNTLSEGENQFDVLISNDCNTELISNVTSVSYYSIKNVLSVIGAEVCEEGILELSATGAPEGGFYRWYESADAAEAISGENGSQYTTPNLTSTKSYFVSIVNEGNCEGARTEVIAIINSLPSSPQITGDSACEGTAASLYATGSTDGNYRWYISSDLSVAPIDGEINSLFETADSGNYYVSIINENGCESSRVLVEAIINEIPFVEIELLENHILQAIADFDSYQWYRNGTLIEGANDKSYQVIEEGIFEFTLIVTKNGCESEHSPAKTEGITGLDFDNINPNAVRIYPNPIGNEALTIKFDDVAGKVKELILSDNQGKVIKVMTIHTNELEKEVDFRGMSNGVYYVHLVTNSNKHVYKILKH